MSEAAGADAPESSGPAHPPGVDIDQDLVSLRLVNSGKWCDVYAVWSRSRWCLAIMKELRAEYLDQEKRVRDLLSEGELLASLAHPSLVQVYETQPGPPPRLLLEVVPGPTLLAVVNHRGRLPVAEGLKVILYIGSALAYLHERGLLHLDVKPPNIVCPPTMPKLVDVGISNTLRDVAATGIRGGTVGFAAPEQTRPHLAPQSEATDVFGLAGCLYFALCGVGPFPEHREFDDPDMPQLRGPAIRPREHNPRLTRRLESAILHGLSPAIADRPQTVREYMRELGACLPARQRIWPASLQP